MELPQLGFGTYRLTGQECVDAVGTALDVGYRHVDTAQLYDNEAAVGEAVAAPSVPREERFLATKVWHDRLAYDDVIESTQRSLDRLGVDAVDLLYVHWPRGSYDAPETLAAFDDLREAGLIEHVGVSNFTPDLLEEARDLLDAPLFAHQVEMHPLLPQAELQADAREHDHHLVAYAPLARGRVADVPEIRAVAEKHDATPAQVSLAWLREKGAVAIPKSGTPAHVRENYRSLELDLDPADVERIDGIERRERLIDPADAAWNR